MLADVHPSEDLNRQKPMIHKLGHQQVRKDSPIRVHLLSIALSQKSTLKGQDIALAGGALSLEIRFLRLAIYCASHLTADAWWAPLTHPVATVRLINWLVSIIQRASMSSKLCE